MTQVMVALVGTNDPINIKGEFTGPMELFLEKKPAKVYLIPTYSENPADATSWKNAHDTKELFMKESASVEIMLLRYSAVFLQSDEQELIDEMKQILLRIKGEAEENWQFIVLENSGPPRARRVLIDLLKSGILPNAKVFEVMPPGFGEDRIREVKIPVAKTKLIAALFYDYENQPELDPDQLLRAISEQGYECMKCVVGAANWPKLESQRRYANKRFEVQVFPIKREIADYQLIGRMRELSKPTSDIDVLILVTRDTGYAHALAFLLHEGQRIEIWLTGRKEGGVPEDFKTLQTNYPQRLSIKWLKEMLHQR